MKTFLVPGLGANESAFQRLGEIGFEKVFVPWIKNTPNESLESYAGRLIDIHEISSKDVLIGLSFGGLVAQYIAKALNQKRVILISSFRTKHDLRRLLRVGLKLGFHKLIPSTRIPAIDETIVNYLNSGTEESKPLLREMVSSTDLELMKWSIDQIDQADTEVAGDFELHNILGNNDRIMRAWNNDNTHIVEGGSHFMIYDLGPVVTEKIRQILAQKRN